jgi:hypothetical protein
VYVSNNKQKIINQITTEIGKKINGNISIQNIELSLLQDFPYLSVSLHKVIITDSMFAQHHHPFLQADNIYLQLSIIRLIEKQLPLNVIKIERGSIDVFTDSSGYSNKYLFAQKKEYPAGDNTSHENNEFKTIELKNTSITIDDRQKLKLLDYIINDLTIDVNDKDKVSLFSAKTNILVKNFSFNTLKGSFLKDKVFEGNFNFQYIKQLKQLEFDSIDIKISDQPFNISGWFDIANDTPQFGLTIHTRNIIYSFAKSLLPQATSSAISIVDLDTLITADATISGPLHRGDPLLYVTWTTKGTHLTTPFLDFDNAAFNGFYTNEVVAGLGRKDSNSKINITDFSATWNDLPVSSNHIEVLNLSQPLMTCDLKSNFPLTTLSDIIGSNSLQLRAGMGSANITYKGPIKENNNSNSFINGVISFSNGNVLYAPRNVEMKNVNGQLLFKNSDVFVENLQCNVLNNNVTMEGEAKNLLALINTEPTKTTIKWNIYSPLLNLEAFIYLLKPRENITSIVRKKRNLAKVATMIDQILDKGNLDVNLKAKKILYRKFEASDFYANINLLQDRYIIDSVSMDHADGNMHLNGSLINQQTNYHKANVNIFLNNVDVNKVFNAFNNFGQDGILSQNLEGKLTAKVNASLAIDNGGKVIPASIESNIDFSLKNGALINYEPVKKLKMFLLKNRDFDTIHFAELKDTLEISNQEIKIKRMEVQSNVVSMFVQGIYSKKGNTDISIQLPIFSNLKKRSADYDPKNISADKKSGGSIFIRGRPGPDGNIKFKLDLFHKFKKRKVEMNS